MEDGPELGDSFGFALAASDFNDDGYADLAVGIPEEDIGTIYNAGAVAVLYGTADGISVTGNQFWHQSSPLVEDAAEEWDSFGYSLAAIAVTQPPPMNTVFLPLIANDN
jgi:hypothetical protein